MDASAGFVARLAAAAFLVDAHAPGRPIGYVNDAFARFTGLAPGQVTGQPLATVLGRHANARDRARLEGLVAAGEAFAMMVSGTQADGSIWRAAMQMAPVAADPGQGSGQELGQELGHQLWLGLLVPAERSEAPAVSQLRHGYQNIMQTMTSLVSLHGRHAPSPAAATAMRDLAARFEALSGLYGPADSAPGDLIDLGDFLHVLAGRVTAVCDPRHHRPIQLKADPVSTSRRTAAVVGQLLAELLIVICDDGSEPRPIGITLAAHPGSAELVVRAGPAGGSHDGGERTRLRAMLARVLVRGLAGGLTEEADDAGRTWRLTWPT